MNQGTNQILFLLLRSAVRGVMLTEEERARFAEADVRAMCAVAKKHDVLHLLAMGLKQNGLLSPETASVERSILKAVYRYEQLNYEFGRLCEVLESANVPFVPLKGTILRRYYPEPWMRTSCDIDVLVHREDLNQAVSQLVQTLGYEERGRATHDVSLFTPGGQHIELHFDLVEEGHANHAVDVLKNVWENVSPHESNRNWQEMSDAFFYFYHVAHMAKHFEIGGCGVRSFLDLWILDHLDGVCREERDALLERGGLLQFANAARTLSRVWLDGEAADALSLKMQDYILQAGIYGSMENCVAIRQKRKGGRIGYVFSRIFLPRATLKAYYPILEKHGWMTPFMQVRRWFVLLNPKVAKRARREILANTSVEKRRVDELWGLLNELDLLGDTDCVK